MKQMSYFEKIQNRIESLLDGDLFVISDFLDVADETTVRKTLSRLEKKGKIHRIMRGIYEKPEFNDFLNEYVKPHPDKIAKTFARNYGWTIVPCGDTALNLLGLSTQVPAVWVYVSDGRYQRYTYDNVVIKFKRTTNKEISKLSYKTALVIQALTALGKENVSEEIVSKIASLVTRDEKRVMFVEAKYATTWIYDVIKVICGSEK